MYTFNPARWAPQAPVFVAPKGKVVRTVISGEPVLFMVENENDLIQSCHMQGAFYEPEELEIIQRFFPRGGRFLDIGANIGNHALYVAKFLHASQVVVIEPNPPAIEILKANMALNQLDDVVDQQFLGYGLAHLSLDAASIVTPENNLGNSRIKAEGGAIPIRTGDALLGDRHFDMIKIDVENMEMAVLKGLEQMLSRTRPFIFLELNLKNIKPFEAWCAAMNYAIFEQFKRYQGNINLMVGPKPERRPTTAQ